MEVWQNTKRMAHRHDHPHMFGEEEVFTAREVAAAIGQLKSGKATAEDEIRPEMLKVLSSEGILWLT